MVALGEFETPTPSSSGKRSTILSYRAKTLTKHPVESGAACEYPSTRGMPASVFEHDRIASAFSEAVTRRRNNLRSYLQTAFSYANRLRAYAEKIHARIALIASSYLPQNLVDRERFQLSTELCRSSVIAISPTAHVGGKCRD